MTVLLIWLAISGIWFLVIMYSVRTAVILEDDRVNRRTDKQGSHDLYSIAPLPDRKVCGDANASKKTNPQRNRLDDLKSKRFQMGDNGRLSTYIILQNEDRLS